MLNVLRAYRARSRLRRSVWAASSRAAEKEAATAKASLRSRAHDVNSFHAVGGKHLPAPRVPLAPHLHHDLVDRRLHASTTQEHQARSAVHSPQSSSFGRCLVTMKRFYVSVVAAQRHAKGFVQCLLARRTLLAQQIDACYQAIWAMGASRRSIRNGKIELKSPVKRRVVGRSLEEADVFEIVRTHIRATRRQNVAGMARRTKAKEDRAEQRRRFKTQCIREAEAQDGPDPTWREQDIRRIVSVSTRVNR
jgi:hypothetical protein